MTRAMRTPAVRMCAIGMCSIRRDDRGVATVLGLALAIVIAGAGAVVIAVVALAVTHQRASVAADLAALAGAARGCDAALLVAKAQGAVSVSCSVRGGDVTTTVALPAPEFLRRIARWTGHEAPVVASSSRAGVAYG